jgi:hypothetical protein
MGGRLGEEGRGDEGLEAADEDPIHQILRRHLGAARTSRNPSDEIAIKL